MTNTNQSLTDSAAEAARSVGRTVGEAATLVKDTVSDLGQTANEKIDQSRLAAANRLDRTASALHQGGEKVKVLANTAAEKLASSASYLREHDAQGMIPDLTHAVRRNPGLALLTAGVIGFLVGRTLKRSSI